MPRPAPRVAPATSTIFPCKACFVSLFAGLGIRVSLNGLRISRWKPQNFAYLPLSHYLGRSRAAALEPFCEFRDSHMMLHGNALYRHSDCVHWPADARDPFIAR